MSRSKPARGFSLIEILLVLAILGIITGIAVPTFIGQRRRARVIGDAMANAKVMAMMLEARRADTGLYGGVATYTWVTGSAMGSAGSLLPQFTPQGNSKMDYTLVIANSGLGYTLTVNDPSLGGSDTRAYATDQTGAEVFRLH